MDIRLLEKGYGLSPRVIWTHPGLTFNEKAVLVYLLSFTGTNSNEAYPHISTICREVGVGKDRVISVLKRLVDKGAIRKEKLSDNPFNQANKYILTLEGFLSLNPVCDPENPTSGNQTPGSQEIRVSNRSLPDNNSIRDLGINSKINSNPSGVGSSDPLDLASIEPEILSMIEGLDPILFSIPRLPKPGQAPSKTLQAIAADLRRLKMGTFGTRPWDPEWISSKGIGNLGNSPEPIGWDGVKSHLDQAIQSLRGAISNGMGWTKIGLSQFLVNSADPSKLRSPFLSFLNNPPKNRRDRILQSAGEKVTDELFQILERSYKRMKGARYPEVWEAREWDSARIAIANLIDWRTANDSELDRANADGQWRYHCGSDIRFLRAVLTFIADENGTGGSLTPRLITPGDSADWKRFRAYLTSGFDITIPASRPKGKR